MDEKIIELRETFFKKLEDSPNTYFHPADINRINSGNDWLRRFLEHTESNLQDALKMLWETCKWRRDFGTNDINENLVKREYLEDGVCFAYGHDKDGKKLFIIKSKLHTKGSRDFSELQRCIVYWFERLEREGNGNQISLFFDMIDSGLSNLDMELTKYLIGLFKNYYPNFLNNILILEMPWVLNAAFNMIKSWLPAKALPKIKFLKKSTLQEFVDPDVGLKCWGGNSDYIFTFVSESQTGKLINGELDNKKVHFAGNSPITEQASSGFSDQESTLIVEPEILNFSISGNEIVGTVMLKNIMSDQNLTYKIKTTSPEKFKVRPNTGIIQASQKISITITLQGGYTLLSLLPHDRFLIMCLPINETMAPQELTEFWKLNIGSAKQHRLMCRVINENADNLKSSIAYSNSSSGNHSMSSLFSKISRIEETSINLQKEISLIKHLLLLSAILIVVLLLWIIYISNKNFQNTVVKESCTIVESIMPKHDEV
ncbi:motile sperm domain-containing protein 2-like [Phymastichus coffea]|uniref:motile sperm domain-containing protein 2-like n=1 Tax=Phymastichus coffea TaxID=108790 RepID=UPI00273B7663|nr:motile sperm domain-containing protein 2-like [Phymastichus coffea]